MRVCSAAEHIKRGDANLMLAGGADAAIIPSGMGGFIACKALSKRNEEPERASRPWDQGRDGFVMGEGAGACRPPYAACCANCRAGTACPSALHAPCSRTAIVIKISIKAMSPACYGSFCR